MIMSKYHTPVLLSESVDGLITDESGVYVDVTFGGGGHSQEVLKRLNESAVLVGFDQDKDAKLNIPNDERFEFVDQNFRYAKNFLRMMNRYPVDGVLADLGVSSHQFDVPERGFSLRVDAALDMRMNDSDPLTAKQVVNEYSVKDLTKILKEFGEVKHAYRIANEIEAQRQVSKIETTFQLLETIKRVVSEKAYKKEAVLVFQAMRIEVNQEIEVLRQLLSQAKDLIKPGGRLVVISYHSLEDRLVKNFMRSGNFEGIQEKDFYGNIKRPFDPINRKVLVPSENEQKENTRSRSAKLRIAERSTENG
jgi:16S rRNA (cytosine1402-N4)-methyltransferase